ncbi:hypothetical protein ILUMI_16802, partial [Ignelater luminosus]
MDEALLVHVMTCNKASEMWVKLTSIYEQSTEMSLQILQSQFFSFKYDESKDIATHISNLTTLVNEIKEAGECISEAMVMARIIISLPRRFQHFVSAWESVPSANQNLNNLTFRLMTEEKRMLERKQNQNNSGMTMFNENLSDTETEEKWYLDSGCNSHMTSHIKYFSHYTPYTSSNNLVKIGDGRLLEAKGIGDIQVIVTVK